MSSDSFESDSSRSRSSSLSSSRSTAKQTIAPAPPPPPPPRPTAQPQPAPIAVAPAAAAGVHPARHHAEMPASSSESDDDDRGGYDHEPVTYLRPSEFQSMLQQFAPGAATTLERGPAQPRGNWGTGGSPRRSAPPRPTTAGTTRRVQPPARDFIDPYRGTNFRNRIHIPVEGGETRTKGRQRAASKLRSQVAAGSKAHPPLEHGKSTIVLNDRQLNLVEELHDVKQRLQRREQELHDARADLRRLEEKSAKQESALIHKGSKLGQGNAESVVATVEQLRQRIGNQDETIRTLEEQLFYVKQSARASRVSELQHQCAAYIAENRRLAGAVKDLAKVNQAGGSSGMLHEAQQLLRQKDQLLAAQNEKQKQLKDEVRRMEDDMNMWRRKYEADRQQTEVAQQRLEELRQAPAEIVRLKRALEMSELAHQDAVRREERHKTASTSERDVNSKAVDTMTRERDQLLAQLQDRDRVAEQQRAEMLRRTQQLDQEIEEKVRVKLAQERQLLTDREFHLKQQVSDWEKKFNEVEQLNVRLRDAHKQELEVQKQREQQRQENMLATMGKYEKDRVLALQKALEERETRLRQQQDELEGERVRWDAERRNREDQLEQLKRLQHEAQVTNSSFASRSGAPSTSMMHPPVSTHGPTPREATAHSADSVASSVASPTKLGSTITVQPTPKEIPSSVKSVRVMAPTQNAKPTFSRYDHDDTQSEATVRPLNANMSEAGSVNGDHEENDEPPQAVSTPQKALLVPQPLNPGAKTAVKALPLGNLPRGQQPAFPSTPKFSPSTTPTNQPSPIQQAHSSSTTIPAPPAAAPVPAVVPAPAPVPAVVPAPAPVPAVVPAPAPVPAVVPAPAPVPAVVPAPASVPKTGAPTVGHSVPVRKARPPSSSDEDSDDDSDDEDDDKEFNIGDGDSSASDNFQVHDVAEEL